MKKLLNVQYTGDYRDAYKRMQSGLGETYFGHQYILRGMAKLGREIGEVAMFCAITNSAYDELPEQGLRVAGGGLPTFDSNAVIEAIKAYHPTHLVLHTPDRRVAKWSMSQGLPTMIMLADSFNGTGLRDRLRYYLLARCFNRREIDWITNHGLKSCISLDAIGVNRDKIIPWDYVYETTPENYELRRLTALPDPIELVYVGAISESKGCGDAIRAIGRLKAQNVKARLRLAGGGDVEAMEHLARQLGLEADVVFVGRIPHNEVVPFFRSGHIALITSRPDYSEGLPLTIYEALTSRTPIVASNHPMFTGNLADRENAMIFKAGDDSSLAGTIMELISDPILYGLLSERCRETWRSLQLPVKWVDVIANWARGGDTEGRWLRDHCLSSPQYRGRLEKLRRA